MAFWSLPGPRAFLEECAHRLDDGPHLIIRAPVHIADGFPWGALGSILRDLGGGELETIQAVDQGPTPIEQIVATFELDDVWSPCQLLRDSVLPCRTLAIDGLAALGHEAQRDWSEFLGEIIRETRVIDSAASRLVCVLSPMVALPPGNSHFSVVSWWGWLSHSDTEIAIQREMRGGHSDNPTEALWTACLCRACAPIRPEIVPQLAAETPRTFGAIMDLLKREVRGADSLGSIETRKDYDIVPVYVAPPAPATSDAGLWECGTLDWHDTHGLVWMALGHPCQLQQRKWLEAAMTRGQRETLLPVVERVRSAIDSWLESLHGENWDADLDYGDGSYDVERREGIQGLFNLVLEMRRSGAHVPQAALDALYKWKKIRNSLAHNSIVSFECLEEAVATYERFCQTFLR